MAEISNQRSSCALHSAERHRIGLPLARVATSRLGQVYMKPLFQVRSWFWRYEWNISFRNTIMVKSRLLVLSKMGATLSPAWVSDPGNAMEAQSGTRESLPPPSPASLYVGDLYLATSSFIIQIFVDFVWADLTPAWALTSVLEHDLSYRASCRPSGASPLGLRELGLS